jgi:hypothetical protein
MHCRSWPVFPCMDTAQCFLQTQIGWLKSTKERALVPGGMRDRFAQHQQVCSTLSREIVWTQAELPIRLMQLCQCVPNG